MRTLPAIALLAIALVLTGCSSPSSGDDASVKPGSGQVTNPSGKPTTPTEAAIGSGLQQQGNAMNDARGKAAAAEAAARAASGGK